MMTARTPVRNASEKESLVVQLLTPREANECNVSRDKFHFNPSLRTPRAEPPRGISDTVVLGAHVVWKRSLGVTK
jgi:hypothetical protein